MRLTHVTITMPADGAPTARAFYGQLLGLREVAPPQEMLDQGNLWFEVGGVDLHLTPEVQRPDVPPSRRHFALECEDVDAVRERLASAGIAILTGSAAPWKRFFVRDPFGNRIEIHELGGPNANDKG